MAKSRIIKELANNEISIEVALSRMLIIASDIGNEALAKWAVKELNGYDNDDAIPEYRIAKHYQFLYSGINGRFQVKNAPLPFDSLIGKEDPSIFYMPIRDGIATIQDFLTNHPNENYGRDLTWAADMVYRLTGIQCASLRQVVPINSFTNLINNLKTALIKVLIELDKSFGSLDDLDIDTSIKTQAEIQQINQIINNMIYIDKSVVIGDKNEIDGSILGSENEQ